MQALWRDRLPYPHFLPLRGPQVGRRRRQSGSDVSPILTHRTAGGRNYHVYSDKRDAHHIEEYALSRLPSFVRKAESASFDGLLANGEAGKWPLTLLCAAFYA